MNKLKDKVALITGGNSGIGLASAKLFKEEGAKVIITARSEETYQKAKTEYGNYFDVVKADVNSNEDLDKLYLHIKKTYGKLDVLFANAGIAEFVALSEITEEHYEKTFNTNVKGLLFSVQKALPILSKGSSVILTSSSLNAKGNPGSSVYSATKAAVRSFARTWTAEIPPSLARFNVLSPGPIETPIWNKMGLSQEQLKETSNNIANSLPAKRIGKVEEIASIALFLASDDSTYMYGSDLYADGGAAQV